MKRMTALIVTITMLAILMVIVLNQKEMPEEMVSDSLNTEMFISDNIVEFDFIIDSPDDIQKYNADIYANLIYNIAYCLYQTEEYEEAHKMFSRLIFSYESGNKENLPELFIAATYNAISCCLIKLSRIEDERWQKQN